MTGGPRGDHPLLLAVPSWICGNPLSDHQKFLQCFFIIGESEKKLVSLRDEEDGVNAGR